MKFFDLALCLSLPFLLTACPGDSPSEPEVPKAELEKVTITVVDRFDQPVPGESLQMKREYRQAMSLQPFEEVGRATTDAAGVVVFEKVKEDDWTEASTGGGLYSGNVTMEKDKLDYLLKLDDAAIGSIGFSRDVSGEEFDEPAQRVKEIVDRILAHYVAEKQTEFFSPAHYLEKGVITRDEADHLMSMAPRMVESPDGINFGWGRLELRISDIDRPISWVDKYPNLSGEAPKP